MAVAPPEPQGGLQGLTPTQLVSVLPYGRVMDFSAGNKHVALALRRVTGADVSADVELREALVALYAHILPEVDRSECRRDLLDPAAVHLVLLRTDEDVRADWARSPWRMLRKYRHRAGNPPPPLRTVVETGEVEIETSGEDGGMEAPSVSSFSAPTDEEDQRGLQEASRLLQRATEFAEDCGRSERGRKESAKIVRKKLPGLSEACARRSLPEGEFDPQARRIRTKDRIVGAASLALRPGPREMRDPCTICQLTYIGVRTRFQLLKLGRRLLQTAICTEAIGRFNADVFFTFAGSNAVRFFRCCGLDDDPLVAGRFQFLDENWTDVVPMVRILKAPESLRVLLSAETGATRGKSAAYSAWRDAAYKRYTEEALFVSHLVRELDTLRARATQLEAAERAYNRALAQERSRSLMYEQIIQSLEEQMLAAGLRPEIDKDAILAKIMERVAPRGGDAVQGGQGGQEDGAAGVLARSAIGGVGEAAPGVAPGAARPPASHTLGSALPGGASAGNAGLAQSAQGSAMR